MEVRILSSPPFGLITMEDKVTKIAGYVSVTDVKSGISAKFTFGPDETYKTSGEAKVAAEEKVDQALRLLNK